MYPVGAADSAGGVGVGRIVAEFVRHGVGVGVENR